MIILIPHKIMNPPFYHHFSWRTYPVIRTYAYRRTIINFSGCDKNIKNKLKFKTNSIFMFYVIFSFRICIPMGLQLLEQQHQKQLLKYFLVADFTLWRTISNLKITIWPWYPPSLKHPLPKKHGHSPIPLLETNHPQRAGIDSTENWGILNDLRNSDREVGPDTTPAAGNIDAKPLLPHPPTNQPNGSLLLPSTDHQQEWRINSLENHGISSSRNSTKNQGILNDSLQFLNKNFF